MISKELSKIEFVEVLVDTHVVIAESLILTVFDPADEPVWCKLTSIRPFKPKEPPGTKISFTAVISVVGAVFQPVKFSENTALLIGLCGGPT